MKNIFRPSLKSINFFSTYLCNSKCINCAIWKNTQNRKSELTSQQLAEMFNDPLIHGISELGFAGGEPTLTDFIDKTLTLAPFDFRSTITTNCLLPDKLFRILKSNPERTWCVQTSIDGIGHIHDQIRGIKSGFKKCLRVLDQLSNDGIETVISFTINKLNARHLTEVLDLANSYNSRLTVRMAHAGGAYDNISNRDMFLLNIDDYEALEESVDTLIQHYLRQQNHSPEYVSYLYNMIPYSQGKVADPQCFAMDTGVVIDCYGDVFPNCPQMMQSIGSLKTSTLSEIYYSERADKMRKNIDRLTCGGCWNDCQIPTNLTFSYDFVLNSYSTLRFDKVKSCSSRYLRWNDDSSCLALIGYHDIESDCASPIRWTSGRFSFFAPRDTRSIIITCTPPPDTTPDNPLEIRLTLDGKELGATTTITQNNWGDILITLPQVTTGIAIADITLNRTYTPSNFGPSKDSRELGLAISNITFAGP